MISCTESAKKESKQEFRREGCTLFIRETWRGKGCYNCRKMTHLSSRILKDVMEKTGQKCIEVFRKTGNGQEVSRNPAAS